MWKIRHASRLMAWIHGFWKPSRHVIWQGKEPPSEPALHAQGRAPGRTTSMRYALHVFKIVGTLSRWPMSDTHSCLKSIRSDRVIDYPLFSIL